MKGTSKHKPNFHMKLENCHYLNAMLKYNFDALLIAPHIPRSNIYHICIFHRLEDCK
jgi:hypothetical protein